MRTDHLDGWRVRYESTPGEEAVYLEMVIGGKPLAEAHQVYRPPTDAAQPLVAVRRMAALADALAAAFNCGSGAFEAAHLIATVERLIVGWPTSVGGAKLIYLETTVERVRVYELDDGQYLKIVDDDFAEVLSAAEMASELDIDQSSPSV